MEQYKIDFESIHWEIPSEAARSKAYKQNGLVALFLLVFRK